MLSQYSAMRSSPFSASESLKKLQNLCRMCASPCNNPVLIFGAEGVENELAVKFNSYLPVKVQEADSLPLQLCYECTNMLIQWDAAVLVAIAADKKLRALNWREQQSQQAQQSQQSQQSQQYNNEQSSGEFLQPTEQSCKRKRSSGTTESLSCSICSRSGMEFRELIDHLKAHEMPADETGENETGNSDNKLNSNSPPNVSDQLIEQELLRPVICLETLDTRIELHSNNQTSESKPEDSEDSNQVKNTRGMKKRFRDRGLRTLLKPDEKTSTTAEGGSGDPVVTSSTNTPLAKHSENTESEDHPTVPVISNVSGANALDGAATGRSGDSKESTLENQGQNNTFKPKVRIISAESINQTLEERAKANLNAKNFESHPSVQSGPPSGNVSTASQSSLKPIGLSQVKKIVLTGDVIKNITDGSKPGPKFLKLADGRIIRLITNNSSSPAKTSYLTATKQQPVPPSVLNKLSAQIQDKQHPCESPSSPDAARQLSPNSFSSPLGSPTDSNTDTKMMLPYTSVNHKIMVSNSRIITFKPQPGPKHSVNRFTCVFCGRKNLTQESLQEHAQNHAPIKNLSP